MSAGRRRGAVVVVLAAWAVVLVAGWQSPAAAHASLLSSNPADGAALEALPSEVVLTFSEPISEPAYVVVNSPDGEQLAAEEVEVDGAEVGVAVEGDGGQGSYTAAFRVVSEDGHPVTGQIDFTVGAVDEASPSDAGTATTADDTTTEPGDSSTDTGDSAAGTGDAAVARWQWAVGLGLLGVAGVLWWLSRRPRG